VRLRRIVIKMSDLDRLLRSSERVPHRVLRAALTVVGVTVLGVGLTGLALALRDVGDALRRTAPPGIPVAQEQEPAATEVAEGLSASAPLVDVGELDSILVPPFSWRSEENVRAGASFLIGQRDFEAAVSLLSQSAATKDAGIAVGVAVLRQTREAVVKFMPAELGKVRDFWSALPQEERDRFYIPRSPEGAADGEMRPVGESLPPELLLAVVINLHVEAVQSVSCPPGCVELVLSPLLRAQPLPRRLYTERPEEMAPIPYAQALDRFHDRFHDACVVPVFRSLLAKQKEVAFSAEGEEARWLARQLGDAGPRLRLFSEQHDSSTQVRELCSALPESLRSAWSHMAIANLAEDLSLGAPRAVLDEQLARLAGGGEPPTVFLREAVRAHPSWRTSLREFRYVDALQSVPGLLERLQLKPLAGNAQRVLAPSLRIEKREFASPTFPWHVVLNSVGASAPPEFWRGDLARLRRALRGGRRSDWRDVPCARLHRALLSASALAQKDDMKKRLSLLARIYATNRGLEP